MGVGLSKKQIISKAAHLTTSMKLKKPFKSGVPVKDWTLGVLKRHPDIRLRSQITLSTVRSLMLNEIVAGAILTNWVSL